MARRILDSNEELRGFQQWLTSNGKSASTARSYTSAVRVTLREVKGREGEKDFMESYWREPEIRDSPNRACAWRSYVKYLKEVFGAEIPGVPRKGGRKKPVEDLPDEVCEAIRMLKKARFTYREIACLAWSDVDLEEFVQGQVERIHVRKPFDRQVVSLVPKAAIDSLFNWCGESGKTHSPLIPREPGADDPYPTAGLMKQASRGEPTLLEKAKMLREKSIEATDRPRTLAEARNRHEARLRDQPLSAKYPSKFLKEVPSGATTSDLLGLGSSEEKPKPQKGPKVSGNLDAAAQMLKAGVAPDVVARFVVALQKEAEETLSDDEATVEVKKTNSELPEPIVGPDGLLYDPNDPESWEDADV